MPSFFSAANSDVQIAHIDKQTCVKISMTLLMDLESVRMGFSNVYNVWLENNLRLVIIGYYECTYYVYMMFKKNFSKSLLLFC